MLFDFFAILLNSICIFLTAKAIFSWWESKTQKDHIQLDPETTLLVTIETFEQSDKKYWLVFKMSDKEFISQGSSEEEAIKNAIKRFPQKNIYQVIEN